MARTKGKAEVAKLNQKLETLEIQYVPISDIKPNTYNPNRQSEEDFQLLLKSMDEDGFTQPVVAVAIAEKHFKEDEKLREVYEAGDTVIVDGEHRWRAAARLGYEEIPVVYTPMTLAQARIATLRHNRARGSEDMELSAQVLRDLQELGAADWAQDSLQLSDEEMNRLLEDIPAPEALAGEDFSQGWEPAQGGPDADAELSDRRTSSTVDAVQAQRDAEERLAAARSEEERQAIRRDMGVYRVALAFSDAEGKIVKAVIGKGPAATIVELCRKELERMTPQVESEADIIAAAEEKIAEQEAEGDNGASPAS